MTTVQANSSLMHFFDRLDGFAEGEPKAHCAEDVQIDMMFPDRGGDLRLGDRLTGGKKEQEAFSKALLASHKPFRRSEDGTKRRHNVDTLVFVDDLELMVGQALGGSRNGTIAGAVMSNDEGKLLKYILVMSSIVLFSKPEDRVANPEPGLIARFVDRLDGVSMEDPLELLAEDFQFETVLPGIDGPPDERRSGNKADFEQFMKEYSSRNPRQQTSEQDRRNHLRTTTVVDGLEIAVGKLVNSRRNGSVFTVVEPDREGKIRRLIVALAPAVHLPDK